MNNDKNTKEGGANAPAEFDGSAAPSVADVSSPRDNPVTAARTFAGVTLASRVLGLVRDIACAALFGATFVWDAFVLAFMVPNVFRRLFGEGSLSAAFLPEFSATREHDGDAAAWRLMRAVTTLLAVVLGVLTLVVIGVCVFVPANAVAHWFGATTTDEVAKLELVRTLLPILFPYVVLVCLAAVYGAALNVHGRFAAPALGPAVLNVFWIGGAVLIGPAVSDDAATQVTVVAMAIIVGGLAQAAIVIVPLLRRGGRVAPVWDPKAPGVRRILKRMGPTILGLGVLQINVLLDNVIAEAFVPGSGAVSALYYGNRLLQFPLALIGIAMGVAVFPMFARLQARGEHAELDRALSDAVRRTVFVAIPASVGLVVLAEPILRVLFLRGAFDGDALDRTTLVLGCYGVGLWASCVLQVVTRGWYALGDTKTPVKVAAWMVVVNVALNVALVHTPLAEAGLALSTAFTAMLNLAILGPGLRRRARKSRNRSRPPVGGAATNVEVIGTSKAGETPAPQAASAPVHTVVAAIARSTVGAAVMGAAVVGLRIVLDPIATESGTLVQAALVVLEVGAGVAIYGIAARLLCAPELSEWLHPRRSATLDKRPHETLAGLHTETAKAIVGACGVPVQLVNGGTDSAALRESWRQFLHGSVQPVANLVQHELRLKLDSHGLSLNFDALFASDLSGRARAFQSMVGGGMEVSKAAALAGLMEE